MHDLIGHFADINDVTQIVYRNDDFGLVRYRHIDIECVYGECIEIAERNEYFQRLLDCFCGADLEQEEVVLFQGK